MKAKVYLEVEWIQAENSVLTFYRLGFRNYRLAPLGIAANSFASSETGQSMLARNWGQIKVKKRHFAMGKLLRENNISDGNIKSYFAIRAEPVFRLAGQTVSRVCC